MKKTYLRHYKINEDLLTFNDNDNTFEFDDDVFKNKMKHHPDRLTQFYIAHYEHEIDESCYKLYKLLNREGQEYLAQAQKLIQKACLASRTLYIPSHIAAMSRDEYINYLKESYHDIDIDNDDLSQFDNIYSAEDYLRHELDFAREMGREDDLKDDIRKSYEDKKERALSRQYDYFRELLSKLTDSEYEFLCYAVEEGTQHDDDCTQFSKSMAINNWNDGTSEGKEKRNGEKIYNNIIKKGVAKEIKDGNKFYYEIPFGLIDVMDIDFNYYRSVNSGKGIFTPLRKGDNWYHLHRPEYYHYYKNII